MPAKTWWTLSEFSTYLQLGWQHIADINAYDHIIFIIALCATYLISEWKKVLVLVTAFTIGHSVTLILAALGLIVFNRSVIEFLIPVTILLTSIYNLFDNKSGDVKDTFARKTNIKYLLAMGFGLIHGMGFSNYFRSLLGKEESIVKPLFAFNVGIELGQLLIVAIIFAITWILYRLVHMKQREWILFISGVTAGISIILMMETKFW